MRLFGLKWLRLVPLLIIALIDQVHKLTMIYGYGWRGGEIVNVTSFFDYVLVWNTGISYGLLSFLPAWALITIMSALIAVIIVWLLKAQHMLLVISLVLIGGGALGNLVDRVLYGAVADFFSFHAFGFSWYIFNLADVAITLGIILWIWDSFFGHQPDDQKA